MGSKLSAVYVFKGCFGGGEGKLRGEHPSERTNRGCPNISFDKRVTWARLTLTVQQTLSRRVTHLIYLNMAQII